MVLNQLQHFLQIEPFFDYKDSLVYDRHKGFYCQVVRGTNANSKQIQFTNPNDRW